MSISAQIKPIPFTVDRMSAVTLTDQVVDGFKRAIQSGYYVEGDYLPPFQDMACALNVSMRIPREVVRRLAMENLVSPRPRVGSLVLPRGVKVCRGHVIAILPAECEGSYYPSLLVGSMRRRFLAAGWLFTCVTIDRGPGGRYDLSQLKCILSQHIDFAIPIFGPPVVFRALSQSAIPCMRVDNERDRRGRLDTFCVSYAKASAEMIAHCRSAGVRSVVVFEYGNGLRFYPVIKESGLVVQSVRVEVCSGADYLLTIKQKAAEAFLRWFGSTDGKLPDLVFFADDYVATGAIMAFASLGLRAPEDLRVVTMSNRGWGPVYMRSLTRIEVDARACGRSVADTVLSRLVDRRVRGDITLGSSYIVGETFPLP